MSVTINSNYAATVAANNLATNYLQLQKSLDRLSTGSRIVNPADDAGGLGVSLKLSAAAKRQGAAETNLANSQSMLQTQDGALATTGNILSRIGELKTLASDPTKNSSDIANYNAEFSQLQKELQSVGAGTFNGIALFGTNSLSVDTTGDQTTAGSLSMAGVNLLGTGGSGNGWNSIGMSTSDWTTSGTSTNNGTTMVVTAALGVTTNQTNIKGPWTLDFMVTTSNGGYGIDVSNSGMGVLHANMTDGVAHHVVITDNGTTTSWSIDGSTQGTQSSLTGTGSSLSFDNPFGSYAITNLSLTNNASSSSGNVASVISATDLGSLNLSTLTSAIADVAGYRAQNGALQSRISYSADMLATNKANLEQANSRISDVDVAQESGTLAKENVLVQAGTSMLSQANQSAQLALKLLG